jgi:hypothetical protein
MAGVVVTTNNIRTLNNKFSSLINTVNKSTSLTNLNSSSLSTFAQLHSLAQTLQMYYPHSIPILQQIAVLPHGTSLTVYKQAFQELKRALIFDHLEARLGAGWINVLRHVNRRGVDKPLTNMYIAPPPGTPAKIFLKKGTLLFRATKNRLEVQTNIQQNRFHYFHPFGCFAVGGLSHSYRYFNILMLKNDIECFYLLKPPYTKTYAKQRQEAGGQCGNTGGNTAFCRSECRNNGVQGYITLDTIDPPRHIALLQGLYGTNTSSWPTAFLQGDASGRYGFPECVIWYQNQITPGNASYGSLVVEPITTLDLPQSTSQQQVFQSVQTLYTWITTHMLGGPSLINETNALISGGQMVPFATLRFNTSDSGLSKFYRNRNQHLVPPVA